MAASRQGGRARARGPHNAEAPILGEGEAEQRVREELAAALYARDLLSFGKASELARVSRFAFADVIAQRGIPRHYGQEELNEDTAYAGGQ